MLLEANGDPEDEIYHAYTALMAFPDVDEDGSPTDA
jgi:hypothetical protein